MNLQQAKRDFAFGMIDGWSMEHFSGFMGAPGGWRVRFSYGRAAAPMGVMRGLSYDLYLTSARKPSEARLFRTVDSAIRVLEEVGFKVEVVRG